MIKLLLCDFWHVLLFPKDFLTRGSARAFSGEEYSLNQELLTYFSKLKQEKQLQLSLFSSGTLFRSPEFHEALFPLFDQGISCSDIHFQKSDPAAFIFLAKKFQVAADEMLFIDDSPKNIRAASEVAVQAIQYHDNQQLISEIEKVFS